MKKKSVWWIWTLLGVILAGMLALPIWITIDPSIMDSYNKAKVTEQNFREDLILQANIVANIVPHDVSVYYLTGDGEFTHRDVIVHGYGVKADRETQCAQFYYPKDNAKQTKLREVCVTPEKTVEKVPTTSPWWNISEDLAKLQKAIQELGASYTGSGHGPGTL